MNAEVFEKVTSGIQNIIVSIATLAAGAWALYTYVFSDPAHYEAFKRQASTYAVPVVTIELACIIPDTDRWIIFADVAIENRSTQTLTLRAKGGDVVSASAITVTNDGEIQLSQPVYGKEGYGPRNPEDGGATRVLPEPAIGAGQRSTFRYLLTLSEAGIYQLSFLADDIQGNDALKNDLLFASTNFVLEEEALKHKDLTNASSRPCAPPLRSSAHGR